jgi:2-polyprenyl-3-methyl-5-hydroxy-6-metoxy-1,4-benzoquinol methylase
MSAVVSRYDDHADWYVRHTGDRTPAVLDLVPGELSGARVADLACGWGTVSRLLAGRGAAVTGVDLSERLIGHARAREAAGPLGIDYAVADVTHVEWWDGEPFDGIVCAMALMDIDDLAGVLTAVASVLRPGGWFAFSLFHPCHPGREGAADRPPSWPPDGGYATEVRWNTGQAGVRGHIGAHHRKLSTCLTAIVDAGLVFEAFAETGTDVPEIFLARCRRGPTPSVSPEPLPGRRPPAG